MYRETGFKVELSVQTILFGIQNSTFVRFKAYYINHIILVGKMCISIVKKTETVNSLHITFEKDIELIESEKRGEKKEKRKNEKKMKKPSRLQLLASLYGQEKSLIPLKNLRAAQY